MNVVVLDEIVALGFNANGLMPAVIDFVVFDEISCRENVDATPEGVMDVTLTNDDISSLNVILEVDAVMGIGEFDVFKNTVFV